MSRVILLILVAAIPVCAGIAAALGGSALFAAIGAGLVLLHWGMDRVATGIGHRGGTSQAVAAGVGGFMIRLIMIGGLLLLVGLLASREQFLSCVLSFMAVFTVALFLKILAGRMAVESR